MPSLPRIPARPPKREWLGGRYSLPIDIHEGKKVFHPDCIMWLELPDRLVVGSTLIDPREPVMLAEMLDNAMLRPAIGPPRRPARIRVASEEMARELRGTAGDIPIVVAPVPELDAAFEELRAMVERSSNPTYLDGGATSPAVIAEFFAAASLIFHAAPWNLVQDQQIIRVDIPAYDIHDACLSVIGAVRESLGLLLFRSIDDFVAFAPRQVRKREPGHPIVLRSLSFDPRKAMPKSLLREIRKHRWPIAGAAGYPALLCFDAEMEQLQATERDFRIMTACTHAFLSFFERHGVIFDIDEPEQTIEVFTADDGVTVTLTAPHPELDALEDDEGELFDDELIESPVTVGPNDPCPCGSGKKYKKCHLEADDRG